MLKVGTLCWIVNVRETALACLVGRIAETTGPEEPMVNPAGGAFTGYPIKRIHFSVGGVPLHVDGVGREHLLPLHDPDWRDTEVRRDRGRSPVLVKTETTYGTEPAARRGMLR